MRIHFSPARLALAVAASAAMPFAISASCDPFSGSLDIYRYDDHYGFFDVFVDDCFFFDCHDYYEIDLF